MAKSVEIFPAPQMPQRRGRAVCGLDKRMGPSKIINADAYQNPLPYLCQRTAQSKVFLFSKSSLDFRNLKVECCQANQQANPTPKLIQLAVLKIRLKE